MLEEVYQFLRAIVVPLAAIIMGGIAVRKLAKNERFNCGVCRCTKQEMRRAE